MYRNARDAEWAAIQETHEMALAPSKSAGRMDRPSRKVANEVTLETRRLTHATSMNIRGSCVAGRRERNSASRAVSDMLCAASIRNGVMNARRTKLLPGLSGTATMAAKA